MILELEKEDKVIEFIWIPSHSGITGNEIVDKFMKIQHPRFINSQHYTPPVPLTDYGSLLKIRMFDYWNKDWEATKVFKGNCSVDAICKYILLHVKSQITLNMKRFKCVNCGEPAAALFKTYGPSVTKLTKCVKCKAVVDKYVEYDPVIVMIDLVLMSKEAQRHILYNTEFKSYWKLLIILVMLETYGVWRSDSLFNTAINTLCGINANNTINITYFNIPDSIRLPDSWTNNCKAWVQEERVDENDLFIWEKDFYVQFLSTVIGIIMFILTFVLLMRIFSSFTSKNEVSPSTLLKGFSLAHASIVLSLPASVWGAEYGGAGASRRALASGYCCLTHTHTATVLYECPTTLSFMVVIASNIVKYTTQFHVTPYLKEFIS
ncbi:hypothetical protein evm_010966 [Chilo suppressalis]|nr:hypothetical protein evm_010966 [Chilo suppressalis]